MTKQVKKYVNQILLLVIMISAVASSVRSQTPTQTPTCAHTGDVTGDMYISSGDAQECFYIALNIHTPTYKESCAADCNGDDFVSSGDAQAIFRATLGSGNCMDPLEEPTPTPPPAPTGFIYIPAGTFQMGAPSGEICQDSDEDPVHEVTISHGFYILSTEVSQQQWVDVFGNNPSYFSGMDRPVENVSWYDCCIYCNRLSQTEGLTPCYYSDASYTTVFDGTPPVTSGSVYWQQSANGYRLPTEAEWEYACRAGTTTAYNSGADNTDCEEDPNLDPLGWYMYNSDTGQGRETHSVGLKQANNWGLYDMHGNVREWCWDRYAVDYYGVSPSTDPTGPASGSFRMLRGGGWDYNASFCRSANRLVYAPGDRYNFVGFRLMRLCP